MSRGYDNQGINHQILLDLPFEEGIGTITRDLAKPHHQDIDLVLTPTWDEIVSGLGVLTTDGTTDEYVELAGADCADLNFTAGDYSIGGWVNWGNGTDNIQTIIARCLDSNNGWELYLNDAGGTDRILNMRHHHAAGATAITEAYSENWTYDTWWFLGISRAGAAITHYRNGVAVITTITAGGMIDPETCNQDLVIFIDNTKNSNHLDGSQWRQRIWNRILTPAEWLQIFEMERHWFGV